MKRLVILFPLVLLFVSCATTSLTAIRNPAISNIRFDRLLVSVPLRDLEMRRHAESQFVAKLKEIGITAIPALEILPPFREYSTAEVQDTLAQHSIDGIMEATLIDAYSKETYVPGSSHTSTSSTIYGNKVYSSSTTRTRPGYTTSEPRVSFEINVYDAGTGQIAWKATTFTRGDDLSTMKTVLNSLAAKVIEQYAIESTR